MVLVWTRIDGVESARRASLRGFYGALAIAIVLLLAIFYLMISRRNPAGLAELLVLDPLYWITAYGIFRMSRTAAVFGLCLHTAAALTMHGSAGLAAPMVIMGVLLFGESIRGTFAFHKYTKQKSA